MHGHHLPCALICQWLSLLKEFLYLGQTFGVDDVCWEGKTGSPAAEVLGMHPGPQWKSGGRL